MESKSPILKKDGEKEPKDSETHSNKADRQKDNWYQKWRKKWAGITPANKFMVPFTGVIAICTLVYALVSAFQLSALIESNNINRDSVQAVQRAFVQWDSFLIQGILKKFPSGDERFVAVTNKWLNSGNTNAMAVVHYFHIEELKKGLDDKEFAGPPKGTDYRTYIGPKGFLGAGDEKPVSFYVGSQQISTTQLLENRKIYFWGWIVYRDIFPKTKPHITEFCKILTAIGVSLPRQNTTAIPDFAKENVGLSMAHSDCDSHNCTDGDCADYDSMTKAFAIPKPN